MVTQIATYLRRWLGYFDDCQTPSVLQTLETWLRRRLRSVVWKQWKRGRARFRELRKRNVSKDLTAQTAGNPHGPWPITNSPVLNTALPNAYFAELGLSPMVARSKLKSPNRRMRTRMYGGVAGEAGRPVPLRRLRLPAGFRLLAFGFRLRHSDLDFARTTPAAESRKLRAALSVTAAGVTVRNLKVREAAGRISLPTSHSAVVACGLKLRR